MITSENLWQKPKPEHLVILQKNPFWKLEDKNTGEIFELNKENGGKIIKILNGESEEIPFEEFEDKFVGPENGEPFKLAKPLLIAILTTEEEIQAVLEK